MRARFLARALLIGCLFAGSPGHSGPQNPPAQSHYERGVQLIEKNCGDCQGATRAGLEAGIAELGRAREAGDARTGAIYRLLGRAYGTLAHVFLPPDSAEQKEALRRQREAYEQALRYGKPDADLYAEYANALTEPKEQMGALLEALAADSRHADARFHLGMLFAAAGEKDEAIYHLRKAVEYATPAQAKAYEPRLQALLDAAGPAAQDSAPKKDGGPRCAWIKFGGEVKRGEAFERPFARDLIFRLEPTAELGQNPPGWTIAIRHRLYQLPGVDMLWPATPPYRFWNPRYLDVSYGHTAAQSVQMTPREFHFFARYADLEIARGALDKLLWPGNHPKEKVDEADRSLAALQRFDGRLHILDSRLGGTAGGPSSIEWLKFDVELCAPEEAAAPAPATPAKLQSIRDLDARGIVELVFRPDLGDSKPAALTRSGALPPRGGAPRGQRGGPLRWPTGGW